MSPEIAPVHFLCPKDMQEYIRRMEMVMQAAEYNNASVPLCFAVDLFHYRLIDSCAQLERWLRGMRSRVYFIAVPSDYYCSEEYQIAYPHNPSQKPDFGLYIDVNGRQEAAKILARLGVDEAENLRRLETTGIIYYSDSPYAIQA